MNIDDVEARIENKTYTPSDLIWLVNELRFAKADKVNTITFSQYQAESARTLPGNPATTLNIFIAAIGLCGESGEVADYIKKIEGHGHVLNRGKLAEELGDILWYVAALSTYYGIDMGVVAANNVEKLKARYPNGFSQQASRERKDGA
jgi:NTP pyrophosphatase (non-canonical NTP hydrolase)